jgi:hypothetical protein
MDEYNDYLYNQEINQNYLYLNENKNIKYNNTNNITKNINKKENNFKKEEIQKDIRKIS